jgi:hypothetical protein
MNYKQAVNWADDIKEYTGSRAMPPWKIAEGIDFNHDRRLSDQEIATLAAWVDEGTPEGNPAEAPPERTYSDGWKLGPPDMVLNSGEDFVLGPGGRDLFRVFVMPTNLDEDKYVVAYEVKPGNPRVVHHTLNFIDGTGQGRKKEERSKGRAGKTERSIAAPAIPSEWESVSFRRGPSAAGRRDSGRISCRMDTDSISRKNPTSSCRCSCTRMPSGNS